MPQSTDALFAALREKFPAEVVKQRAGRGSIKLDYIDIATTLHRLNDVLGVNWNTELLRLEAYPKDSGWAFVIALKLTALGKDAVGVGAAEASDPDDAVKTALAEAIKKAGHQFGIGLELWDEDWRNEIAASRAPAQVSIDATTASQLRRTSARQRRAG